MCMLNKNKSNHAGQISIKTKRKGGMQYAQGEKWTSKNNLQLSIYTINLNMLITEKIR